MAEIPDLIKLREIPADYAQRLDTDLLETSTFQEATATQPGFARFDLQQKVPSLSIEALCILHPFGC